MINPCIARFKALTSAYGVAFSERESRIATEFRGVILGRGAGPINSSSAVAASCMTFSFESIISFAKVSALLSSVLDVGFCSAENVE